MSEDTKVVKMPFNIYVTVKDDEQAQEAAQLIESQAATVLNNGFPHGQVEDFDMTGGIEDVSQEELEERGLVE